MTDALNRFPVIFDKGNIFRDFRPRGYKTFFMLNSAEHEMPC